MGSAPLEVEGTLIEGVLEVTPRLFTDERGESQETWNAEHFSAAVGRPVTFVQDNQSRSIQGVLRGIHYQLPNPQGKLVRCVQGSIWDVVVDLRSSSPTYLKWHGIELSSSDTRQVWIPEGCGHGFLTLSSEAVVSYKLTDYFDPTAQHALRWDDPSVAVDWPLQGRPPVLSAKDEAAKALADLPLFD